MIIDLTMPQLGESVTEGMIAKWLKRPGDIIHKYEPICEVATDKVNAEVPSTHNGVLAEIIVAEGETVSVGHVICQVRIEGIAKKSAFETKPSPEGERETTTEKSQSQSMKQRYSPAVLRLADEHQLDLTQIVGSGKSGRITRKDIQRIIEDQEQKQSSVPSEEVTVFTEEKPSPTQDQVVPLSPVRRTIAERMVQSKQEIPHAWLMMEADVTGLVAFRERMKDAFREREGTSLTFMPFFIKAVVDSLKDFPQLNSIWNQDQIILKKQINISVAMSTEKDLYVPVIHDADEISLLGLAKKVNQLKDKTFRGKLDVTDIRGGTFTVNNTGAFGSIASQPIINPPQAAILSFEAIVKRPVVIDQMIGIRDMMNLCLSLDHRIIDGWISGRFLQAIKQRLEAYGPNTKGIL